MRSCAAALAALCALRRLWQHAAGPADPPQRARELIVAPVPGLLARRQFPRPRPHRSLPRPRRRLHRPVRRLPRRGPGHLPAPVARRHLARQQLPAGRRGEHPPRRDPGRAGHGRASRAGRSCSPPVPSWSASTPTPPRSPSRPPAPPCRSTNPARPGRRCRHALPDSGYGGTPLPSQEPQPLHPVR